jgi:hypothetical protein
MAMQCEGDKERQREVESAEKRSRRLRALVEEWTKAIDEVREEEFKPEFADLDFEKTMKMPMNKPERSH